jgi:signal transduction histidine kinase
MQSQDGEMAENLVTQWQTFTSSGTCDETAVRPVILRAWKRCRELGLEPEELQLEFLDEDELATRREANRELISAAAPYLDHLSRVLSDRSHAIALADADGWILELRENPPDSLGGRATGICAGASWAERNLGSNGVGTALASGEPTLVYGVEHYATSFHSAHCLGVPIRFAGQIVGCLDISVTREEDARPEFMTLAQACVASIETSLGHWRNRYEEREELERFAAIGSLLATTVHDLKNPLTVIKGLSELGAVTLPDGDERAYFLQISRHVDELVAMLSKVHQEPDTFDDGMVNLGSLVSEIVDEVRPLCDSQQIRLELKAGELPPCPGDRLLLKRCLHNLIANAIKAMPDGGELKIGALLDGSRAVITVSDSGPGIPDELQSRVFEPFVHGEEGGTGLGLFSVRETVSRLHEGEVWFESSDEGTRFFVELPLRRGAEADSA